MTKFEELQQAHQHLLDRIDDVTDKAAFVREVQDYVTRVCNEAVDVPAPRDRDQLRANLRYWASYLYDATGTYPNTTMRPAQPVSTLPENIPTPTPTPTPTRPPEKPRGRSKVLFGAIGVTVTIALVLIVLIAISISRLPGTGLPPESTSAPQPRATPSAQATDMPVEAAVSISVTPLAPQIAPPPGPRLPFPLHISAQLLTRGPSPFDPQVWVAKIRLDATGGNGEYIFWINGERNPTDEYTLEARGCQAVKMTIGVTSDGQSDSGQIYIKPPDSCP